MPLAAPSPSPSAPHTTDKGDEGDELRVSLADRWVALGMTECGKTTFCRELIRRLQASYPQASTYILDSKGQGDFDGWPGFTYSEHAPKPAKPGVTQVWQPETDDLDEYGAWLSGILKARRPAIVMIDELSSIAPNPRFCPPDYQRILKQGRGLNISVISCTQEACYIPRQVIGQTTHVVRFRLQDEIDARKIDKLLGRVGQGEPTAKHGFFYSRVTAQPRRVHSYDDYREFF